MNKLNKFLALVEKGVFLLMVLLFTSNALAGTPQSNCAAQGIRWGEGCSGSTIDHSGSDFKQYVVSSSSQGFEGSATVQCVHQDAGAVWQINSQHCSQKRTEGASQGSNGATLDGRSIRNAHADSTMIGGTYNAGAGAPPPPVPCAAGQVNWTAGGYACQGYATADGCKGDMNNPATACPTPGNSSTLVADAYGRGSAYYRCNGTNGNFEMVPGSADCSGTVYCPAQNDFNWTVDGITCSTDISSNTVAVNSPRRISHDAAKQGGKAGQVTVECVATGSTDGSGSPTLAYYIASSPRPTCVESKCPAISPFGWGDLINGQYACSHPGVPEMRAGETGGYYENQNPGYAGRVSFSCEDRNGNGGSATRVSRSDTVCGTDSDGDGVEDFNDYCVNQPGVRSSVREENGCPTVTHTSGQTFALACYLSGSANRSGTNGFDPYGQCHEEEYDNGVKTGYIKRYAQSHYQRYGWLNDGCKCSTCGSSWRGCNYDAPSDRYISMINNRPYEDYRHPYPPGAAYLNNNCKMSNGVEVCLKPAPWTYDPDPNAPVKP